MSKKVLSLVLAIALIFSSFTVVLADEVISEDVRALAAIGMLIGDGNNVTVEYAESTPTRLQAAILFLRLRGLEEEALEFEGEENFNDAKGYAWAEGSNLMAYLKAHPELGWIGAEGNFMPNEKINEQSYYKVLLEALGYKQNTGTVVGDFEFSEVFEFAKLVGLNPENLESFSIDNLAKATVAALKNATKDGKLLIEVLIDSGKIDKDVAVNNGLYEDAIAVAVKSAKAVGNAVVEVEFEEEVEARYAEKAANYEIAGLDVNAAQLVGDKVVRLETAAMTAGKLYTLVVGESKVEFAGVAKASGGPELSKAVSEDVEEVVLTFSRKIDFETGSDVENYTIAKVEVLKAEVDGDTVTLTTEGLADKTSYTVKATNLKSTDGVVRKTTSASFKTKVDKSAPRIDADKTEAETNQRIVVYFNEPVTKESAEDLENYEIVENKKDGSELEIVSVVWDEEDKDNVEIVTEAQTYRANYKLSVSNIADRRKVANVMTRAAVYTFAGVKEDVKAPVLNNVEVYSRNLLIVDFVDDSRIDAESALDTSNYTLTEGKNYLDVENVEKLSGKKFLVTVEDMEAGRSHSLKVAEILDEFGNAMQERAKSFTPGKDKFASAYLKDVKFEDKNTVVLEFDKEIDKKSAESISNYSLNNDIGAPTKAKYDADNKKVKLTVNDLTQGVQYKITVDGVTDLAGNVIKVTTGKLTAAPSDGGKWDNDDPELDNVYAVDKHVLALEFDKEVKYDAGTKLTIAWKELVDGVETDKTKDLDAKAYTNDNTVIEFSAESFAFNAKYTYKIEALKDGEIKDLAGNKFALEGNEEFDGSDADHDKVYVETIDQVNGGTFKVTMSRNVKFKSGITVVDDVFVAVDAKGKSFNVTIKDNAVKFVGTIEYDTDYEFDLNDFLVDEHGLAIENYDEATKTVLAGEYTDDEAPYLVDVVAIDRIHVEIEFSEDIATAESDLAGFFSIKNLDVDKDRISITEAKKDGAKVTLTLGNALEGRYEYELSLAKGVKDFAGKEAEKDVFVFDGTDLAPSQK
ncbi:MAG: hypothetical protein GX154_00255 [Clostridiales bacterium]|nr:hypothetical protein [Clostridiales bacterium]